VGKIGHNQWLCVAMKDWMVVTRPTNLIVRQCNPPWEMGNTILRSVGRILTPINVLNKFGHQSDAVMFQYQVNNPVTRVQDFIIVARILTEIVWNADYK
jgi:hypothetical protein